MAALTTARNTPEKRGEVFEFVVKADVTIHQGSLVMLENGEAVPGRAATGAQFVAVGRAEHTVTATAAEPARVRVRRGIFKFANAAAGLIAATGVGRDCFIADDQTVGTTAGVRAGIVTDVEDDGVWVQIGLGL